MSELWRDPRRAWLLMTAWFLLSLATGPILFVHVSNGSAGISAAARLVSWGFSAFFAWRVTRGGRISRMLLILAAAGGFIAGFITLAVQPRPAELGMLVLHAAQAALLLSPAVYLRTRPGAQPSARIALWRRRSPARLMAALTVGALLGLVGAAVCGAVIGDQIRDYNAATVRVPPGHMVSILLSPGNYGAFVGCADWGCPSIEPRDLSIQGVNGADTAVSLPSLDERTDAGQLFAQSLKFTVPLTGPVWFTLHRNPGQPVLIAPAQTKKHMVRDWVVAAACFGLVLLGSLAGLAWPAGRRGGPAWR